MSNEEKLRQLRSKESESLIQIRKYECEINSLKGSVTNAKAENESLRKQLNCKVGKIEKKLNTIQKKKSPKLINN